MKKFLAITLFFSCAAFYGQQYPASNISLLSVIAPDTASPKSGNTYSGCWGWYQASKNKEYAIAGGRNGTYFIDVTNPTTPSVSAYVDGVSKNCTWRELKTYQNYCYIVSDDCQPNAFQIVDMQYLPDSVRVVHSGTSLFTLGHTAWIDQNKLYVASTTFGNGNGTSPMSVWSLADPENPVLMRRLEQDDQVVNQVHDMYVRNDTVYASAGWHGLRVYKFNSDSTFTQLGSYTNYLGAGYNHSSFLTSDGKHLVFCDEVPQSLPVKLINVENLANMQPVSTWTPEPKTTPHNPYVIGNKWALISAYQDGLFIYDISNPSQVSLAGFFDTYPQGGHNTGDYGAGAYAGNWGAYPFLPSGVIIAQDMSNGIFLLDANTILSVKENNTGSRLSAVFPNPADSRLHIELSGLQESDISIFNILGEIVFRGVTCSAGITVNTEMFPSGAYLLVIENPQGRSSKKIIIRH